MEKELTEEQQISRDRLSNFLKRAEKVVDNREVDKENLKDYHTIEYHVYETLDSVTKVIRNIVENEVKFEYIRLDVSMEENGVFELLEKYIELQRFINVGYKNKHQKELIDKYEELREILEEIREEIGDFGYKKGINIVVKSEKELEIIEKMIQKDRISIVVEGEEYRLKDIETNIEIIRDKNPYEDRIEWILEEIDRGVWDGRQQINMSKEESDLVESAKIEGYIIYNGDERIVFKGGAIYTGRFFLTDKGKSVLVNKEHEKGKHKMETYEDLVKKVLERVDSGDWEGKSQINFTHEYGDLVIKVIEDGYIENIGGFWERSKEGVHYQGKIVITDKGKELLGK